MDKYAELRAALEAATPGPWESGQFSGKEKYAIGPDINHRAADAYGSANARYIAAAHPEAIRALLAERDALRKALHGSDSQLREVLASIADERVHFDGDEFHTCLAANRAALAQEQP